MKSIEELNIKVFADGADLNGILSMNKNPIIKGFTTNPTLMRKAGILDYTSFAKNVLKEIKKKPISFEVFSDDFLQMERQAIEIAGWGDNVYVKIPISNSKGVGSYSLINKLTASGVKLNITAIMTLEQIKKVLEELSPSVPSYVSVFAGRIADTGVDPLPLMRDAVELLKINPNAELIWASPRELLNVFHAESVGCHIITATNDILKKIELIGKKLEDYSLETVKMFYEDALAAGFKL